MRLVICNKVQQHCKKWCSHSTRHEPYETSNIHKPYKTPNKKDKCTSWGECTQPDGTNIKVRCTHIKEE